MERDATYVLPCFKAFPVDYAAFLAMNEYQLWNALARWYGQKPCKKAMTVDCLGTLRAQLVHYIGGRPFI